MKVSFNPVSFRADDNYQQKQTVKEKPVENPFLEALARDNERAKTAGSEIELFNGRLHDEAWEKKYFCNGVHLKFPNSFDGTEYQITTNGSVIRTDGWSSPKMILKEHEGLSKYVQAMKEYSEKTSDVPFKGLETSPQISKTNLLEAYKSQMPNFESSPVTKPAEELNLKTEVKNAAENEVNKETTADKEQIIADYKTRLKDDNWEKLYSKEDDTIYLKEKNKFDGSGYMIAPDGTVKKVGANIEPTVIVEKDEDSKKLFETKPETEPEKGTEKKKSTLKDKFANVWKYFATFGQMTVSVAKGVGYGAATAATMLAGSWVFNTLPKAFAKEGPKFAQIIKHPLKHIGTSGKVLAGLGAAAVLAYHLIVGKMVANQKTAVIDHKLYTGHRDV